MHDPRNPTGRRPLTAVVAVAAIMTGAVYLFSGGDAAVPAGGEPTTVAVALPTPTTIPSSTPVPPTATPVPPTPTPVPTLPKAGYRISVVWPHDGNGNPADPGVARAANLSLWPREQVRCGDQPPVPQLWHARDGQPAEPVPVDGQFVMQTAGGVPFPALVYNNVPADLASDPGATERYFLWPGGSSVWVHALPGARAAAPVPTPAGLLDASPAEIDSYIRVVWPHDGHGQPAPVETAAKVNIAVDLYAHGTRRSVPLEYDAGSGPVLNVAVGDEPFRAHGDDGTAIASARRATYQVGDQTYPTWLFDNVPVEPGRPHHFAVDVPSARQTFPTVWYLGPTGGGTAAADPTPPPVCRPGDPR